jgi:flagellar biosynthesis protein FlhA
VKHRKLIDGLPEENKKLVADIIPSQITITALQRIFQGLLNESISIRDLPTILEAVSEATTASGNVLNIIEHVRSRLSKQICYSNMTEKGYVPFIILSPQWEQVFYGKVW